MEGAALPAGFTGSGGTDDIPRVEDIVVEERGHVILSRITTLDRASPLYSEESHVFKVSPDAHMLLIPFTEFKRIGRIPRSSDKATVAHVQYDELVSRGDRPTSIVCFISHRWLNSSMRAAEMHPDNEQGLKYATIVQGLQRLIDGMPSPHAFTLSGDHNSVSAEDSLYLWIDFFCIDQDEVEPLRAGIRSLPAYIERCDIVFTPYNETLVDLGAEYHSNSAIPAEFKTGSLASCKSILQYLSRGWCRLEMFISCHCPLTKHGYPYFKALGVHTRQDRPHLFYGDHESPRGMLPSVGPQLVNGMFKLLNPVLGAMTVPSDKDVIASLVSIFKIDTGSDEDVYEGEEIIEDGVAKGRPHGRGKMVYSSGDIYHGEWCRGEWNGYGTYIYTNGTVYNGEWKSGRRHGRGELFLANGLRFEGEFMEGDTHGPGTLYYQNGNPKLVGTKDRTMWSGPLKQFYVSGTLKYDGITLDNSWNGSRIEYSDTSGGKEVTVVKKTMFFGPVE